VPEKAKGTLVGEIGQSDPRFAVAAPIAGTTDDRSGETALRRMQGQRPLYGRPACLLATQGTDGDASRSVRRPRYECAAG
jgi:hypothetical protein